MFFAKNLKHLWFKYPRFFVCNMILMEQNTFSFLIETHNGIRKPCVFVVRIKVCNLQLLNSNFHHDDGESLLQSSSLNLTSKWQEDVATFVYTLTRLLKMVCMDMDKGDVLVFFSLIQPLLFVIYVQCFMSSAITCNLCFMFFEFQKWRVKKVFVVYCRSSCHLLPVLFHLLKFFWLLLAIY
jgi:hypothetical protein